MFRVHDLFFVEGSGTWAITLVPDHPGRKLEPGAELASGMRRWKVATVSDAPNGLVGVTLEGPRVTRGLVLREAGEPMGEAEHRACAVLLVRLSRALRAIDFEGFLDELHRRVVAGGMTPAVAALGKNAVLAKTVVESGATDEQLAALADELGIGDEV